MRFVEHSAINQLDVFYCFKVAPKNYNGKSFPVVKFIVEKSKVILQAGSIGTMLSLTNVYLFVLQERKTIIRKKDL